MSYEDPNYGTLRWRNDDGTETVETLTCLEPECERGPCKQPDEHERWFQVARLSTSWYQPQPMVEGAALRVHGFAVLCRNCRHWARRHSNQDQAGCTKTHPLNDNGKPLWPATRHDHTCGEWQASARLMRAVKNKEKPRMPDGEACWCPEGAVSPHWHRGIGIKHSEPTP